MNFISETDERNTTAALVEYGYLEIDPGVYHLALADGLGWLVECCYQRYVFSEWNLDAQDWRKLADFHNGDVLTTVLEAIGAVQCS